MSLFKKTVFQNPNLYPMNNPVDIYNVSPITLKTINTYPTPQLWSSLIMNTNNPDPFIELLARDDNQNIYSYLWLKGNTSGISLYTSNGVANLYSELILPNITSSQIELRTSDSTHLRNAYLNLSNQASGHIDLYIQDNGAPTNCNSQFQMANYNGGTCDWRFSDNVVGINSYVSLASTGGGTMGFGYNNSSTGISSNFYLPTAPAGSFYINFNDGINSIGSSLYLPTSAGGTYQFYFSDSVNQINSYLELASQAGGNHQIVFHDNINNIHSILQMATQLNATQKFDFQSATIRSYLTFPTNAGNYLDLFVADTTGGGISSSLHLYNNDGGIELYHSNNVTNKSGYLYIHPTNSEISLYSYNTTGGVTYSNYLHLNNGSMDLECEQNTLNKKARLNFNNYNYGYLEFNDDTFGHGQIGFSTQTAVPYNYYQSDWYVENTNSNENGITLNMNVGSGNDGVYAHTTIGRIKLQCNDNAYGGILIQNFGNNDIELEASQSASVIKLTGGRKEKITPITDASSPYAPTNDYVVLADSTLGNITINLPTVGSETGRVYIIKNTGTANTVTITPNGVQTIDGNPTLALTTMQKATIICDGVAWWTI